MQANASWLLSFLCISYHSKKYSSSICRPVDAIFMQNLGGENMQELKIKFDNIDHIQLIGGTVRKTAAAVFAELKEKPDYLINAGMYDMKSGLTVCDTIVDGVLLNGGNYTNKGFAWREKQPTLAPMTTDMARDNGYAYFIGGSPSLIWDGKLNIDGKGFTNYFLNTAKSLRIGIGISDKELIICFPTATKTIGTFAGIMAAAGCRYAINLDGGGSTRVMQNVGGKLKQLSSNSENRANSTWLAIYLKKGGNTMSKKKICIDPGHGGTDPGAVGHDGAKEKDIVLQIGLKLRDALQRNGIDAVMTREKDIESGKLVIADRCKIANSASVDYLVSIHANADSDRDDKTGYGTETWAYSASSSGYPLAQAVQKELIAANGLTDRGVKVKQWDILKGTKAPAILVETAFLNNTAEEKLLTDAAFQLLTAEAIAKGIVQHIGQKWVPAATPKYNLQIEEAATGEVKRFQIDQENRNGTIWAPVREVAEALGCKVGYDSNEKSVVIHR